MFKKKISQICHYKACTGFQKFGEESNICPCYSIVGKETILCENSFPQWTVVWNYLHEADFKVEGEESKVCLLKNGLYDLKKATFSIMVKECFWQSNADSCVYVKCKWPSD